MSYDWRKFWKRFRECFVFQSRVSTKTVVNYNLNTLLSYPGWKSQSDNQSLWPSPVIITSPLKKSKHQMWTSSVLVSTDRWCSSSRNVYNMIGLLPWSKTEGKQLKQWLRLKNNRSCLQYQTKAGYDSCYTTELISRVMFDRVQSCFLQRLSRDDLKFSCSERGDLKE